jgi:ribose transport system permease protein
MYTRSILPSSHGNFYELYAIAATVLGGFSLRGGEGSVIGVVLGVILLQVLQNLVNLLGIPLSLNFAVSGSVILIGVLADQEYADFRERRERLRRLAAGGAAAPAEPAIHADYRIASSASMELSAAKDLQIPVHERPR